MVYKPLERSVNGLCFESGCKAYTSGAMDLGHGQESEWGLSITLEPGTIIFDKNLLKITYRRWVPWREYGTRHVM